MKIITDRERLPNGNIVTRYKDCSITISSISSVPPVFREHIKALETAVLLALNPKAYPDGKVELPAIVQVALENALRK